MFYKLTNAINRIDISHILKNILIDKSEFLCLDVRSFALCGRKRDISSLLSKFFISFHYFSASYFYPQINQVGFFTSFLLSGSFSFTVTFFRVSAAVVWCSEEGGGEAETVSKQKTGKNKLFHCV